MAVLFSYIFCTYSQLKKFAVFGSSLGEEMMGEGYDQAGVKKLGYGEATVNGD
jgi:hypothetical protein